MFCEKEILRENRKEGTKQRIYGFSAFFVISLTRTAGTKSGPGYQTYSII